MTDAILAIVSDLHSNSTVGLCAGRVALDDGGYHAPGLFQRWLWRQWLTFWDDVAAVKADTGLPVVTVFNGDTNDGDHHETAQIISRNPVTMLRTAYQVVEPALDVSDAWYVVRGTPAHGGKSAWLEEKLAEDISAVPESKHAHSWWHLPLEVGGVLFDIQHHPESKAYRPWTAGADANRIAAVVTYEYASTGDRIPDVAVRSHGHKWRDSGDGNHPVRAFITPAWQGSTAFIHKIGSGGQMIKPGGMYFVCRDGGYTPVRRIYPPRRRRPEKVTL
jgi:hypothetical protein